MDQASKDNFGRSAAKRRREWDDGDQEDSAMDEGARAGGEGSASVSRTVLEPPRPAGCGELGLEEAKLVYNSCVSPVYNNLSDSSFDSQVSAKPKKGGAIVQFLAKAAELREKLAFNSEELRIVSVVETFLQDLLAGSVNLELDVDSDDDAYESDSDDESQDGHDPTKSKYAPEQWSKIIDLYFVKGWKFKAVKHNYKRLTSAKEIHRARDYLERGGNQHQKWKAIDELVYEEFKRLRAERIPVHDRDLQELALAAGESIELFQFRASSFWLFRFKRRHRIVGRKVTKFVGHRARLERGEDEVAIRQFREEMRTIFDTSPLANILNSDQAGINLEMTEGRTLETKGVVAVEAQVQRINATTHSFSVQLLISADGVLHEPTMVCFYEPSGAPAKFDKELSRFTSLNAVWSTSGLFHSDHQLEWIEQLKQRLPDGSHLMLDSWGGFNRAINNLNEDVIRVHRIPKRTTGVLQPLDVFCIRQLKLFIRILSSWIRRCHPDFILSKRENIAILLNQVLHQCAAPRFRNFVRYSFFRSGYTQERPPAFKTPPQYCLNSYSAGEVCDEEDCKDKTMIRCAYCESCLCFKHFLMEMHRCDGG
jgi:hypothetical protein